MALDFPSNPVDGQVYDNFVYDAAKGTWKSISAGVTPTVLVNPTITNPTITNSVITATAPNSTTVPLTVNGADSQSANLQEWKNSTGTILSQVSQNGNVSGVNLTSTSGPDGIQIKPGSADHAYISYYPRTASPNTRRAYMGFASSGTNNFTIANEIANSSISLSSTYVTMPNNPAFRAFLPSGPSNSNISFSGNDSAFAGRNAGWNGSSRFTAPIAGVYNFSFSFLVNDAVYYARTLFRINGTFSTGYGDNLASTYGVYNVSGMSMTFKLNANDYVELYNEGAPVYGSSYGSFSGFLVG